MIAAVATLVLVFAYLSLLAVGGANALLPEMQREAVAFGWVDARAFADLFALAQAAPGPNMLIVTLIGWRVAGLAGALAATIAFVLPAALLVYTVAGLWHRFREAAWRQRVQAGLTPVTVGLAMGAAALLCRASIHGPGTALVALAAASGLLATRLHPLWLLGLGTGLGAGLGAAGFLQ